METDDNRSSTDTSKAWIEDIFPNWSKGTRKSTFLKRLCNDGIPSSVRGRAWQLLIGNRQRITSELYEILLSEYVADSTNAIKQSTGGHPAKFSSHDSIESKRKHETGNLIDTDLRRTRVFLNLVCENNCSGCKSPTRDIDIRTKACLQEKIRNILHAFVYHRPDIGYVQGMTYVATIFSYYLDEYTAFECFSNLLSSRLNFEFYQLESRSVTSYVMIFSCFFRYYMNDLFLHFLAENISPEMFLMDWYLTIFAKVLPLNIVVRIWDIYLLEGEIFLLRTSLGILKLFHQYLLQNQIETIINFLTHYILFENIEIDDLLSKINSIIITKYDYEQVIHYIHHSDVDKNLPQGCHRMLKADHSCSNINSTRTEPIISSSERMLTPTSLMTLTSATDSILATSHALDTLLCGVPSIWNKICQKNEVTDDNA